MRPAQIKQALNVAVQVQRPAFIWGAPGIGKSDIVAQVAKDNDMQMVDVRLNLMDPTDIKGFPVPDTEAGHMHWLPADFLPHMEVEAKVKGKTAMVPNPSRGILFLDELNQAPPMVQAAAYQLLLTRSVGNYTLPSGWAILAAGNRESDRANAQRMPSALALRLIHLDMDINVDDWCDWALNNNIAVELLTFIRFRPDLLHKFDPAERSSPNPRSWVFASEIIGKGLDPEVEFAMLCGSVGEGPAAEFRSYLQVFRELPTVDSIKLDPDSVAVSEKAAVLFAITGALAHATTKDVYPRFKKYIDRLEPEWQVVYTKDAQKRCFDITTTKEFMQFAVKHSHLLA